MYIMADQFKLPPWQYNEDGSVYQEDISDILSMKKIEWAAHKQEMERQQKLASSGDNRTMRVR